MGNCVDKWNDLKERTRLERERIEDKNIENALVGLKEEADTELQDITELQERIRQVEAKIHSIKNDYKKQLNERETDLYPLVAQKQLLKDEVNADLEFLTAMLSNTKVVRQVQRTIQRNRVSARTREHLSKIPDLKIPDALLNKTEVANDWMTDLKERMDEMHQLHAQDQEADGKNASVQEEVDRLLGSSSSRSESHYSSRGDGAGHKQERITLPAAPPPTAAKTKTKKQQPPVAAMPLAF
jgi:hypothetical protein